MGFLSQAGHLGIKTQAAKGTYLTPAQATPGTAAPGDGVFLYTKSGSLGGNRELLIPDPEIGGNRDIPDAQLGPIAYSGEFEFYARMDALPTLLRAALGNGSGTTTTGNGTSTPFTHTIVPNDGGLPWLSVEEKVADGYMIFRYTDCKVNTLHLEADANGYLMGTVGLIGLTQQTTTETPIAARDYDTTPMIVGSNVCVRWNGVELPAKSFSLDINNNIEDDDFRLCSMTLGDLVEKRREVTMSCTIRPQDSTLWKTAMWGSPSATAPLGQSYKDDVQVEFSSYEDIPGVTPAAKYNALMTIPSAIIAPFNVEPSGDDVIEHDIEIRPVRPTPSTPIVTSVVKNGLSTIR
jgi:hypothetical protein